MVHSLTLVSLRTFLHPLLRILGMSTPLPRTEEFPGDVGVEDWERSLLNLYCSRDPDMGPGHRIRMKCLKITTIRRYKERKRLEHEYLVAEVSVPGLSQLRYLRIERAVEDPPPSKKNTTDKSPLHAISTFSSQSSLATLKKLPAHDHVKAMEVWPNDICIDNLNCKATSIILLDLAIAAKLVHDHSDKYHLFKHQCFWYSDMIVAVLRQGFPESQLKHESGFVEADHSPDGEMEILDEMSGTYKRVKIYSQQKPIVEEIHETFKIRKPHVYSLISEAAQAVEQSALEKRELHKQIEEERKGKEKARKGEEEARKQMEEERKAKEEERKAKEEARKGEEEVRKQMEEERKAKEEARKGEEEVRKQMEEAQKMIEEGQNDRADLIRRIRELETQPRMIPS
ncbi:hypothetical protein BYT27DRAFT_7246023 [Phlegmacium glaucopus]|nr:hypothetical protein BYT27DRAFT_7246023 [Phlegmacium glaucopus]